MEISGNAPDSEPFQGSANLPQLDLPEVLDGGYAPPTPGYKSGIFLIKLIRY